MNEFAQKAPDYRDALSKSKVRTILLEDVVQAGEIPSPTGQEDQVIQFLKDRFTESDLHNISVDKDHYCGAIIPGTSKRNILVVAHLDKIWPASEDHTVQVLADTMSGPGIADNGLGVAALASMPLILEDLGIELKSNIILLGTTKSLGDGDLAGMRFFLEHKKRFVDAAICLEGLDLGRLSFSSLGMIRGEITVKLTSGGSWPWYVSEAGSGAIGPLNQIVESIMKLDRPGQPRTSILLGSVRSGSGFNVPPQSGSLKFEVRSESEEVVERIHDEIQVIVAEAALSEACDVKLSIVARRSPGDTGFQDPLVRAAREVMESLNIEPCIAPSISELSELLHQGIPALTLGITTGENRSTPEELIYIDPIFTGLAQIVALLQSIDSELEHDDE